MRRFVDTFCNKNLYNKLPHLTVLYNTDTKDVPELLAAFHSTNRNWVLQINASAQSTNRDRKVSYLPIMQAVTRYWALG